MTVLTATAVTQHAGTFTSMLPKFGVIALVVAVIVVALMIYNHMK